MAGFLTTSTFQDTNVIGGLKLLTFDIGFMSAEKRKWFAIVSFHGDSNRVIETCRLLFKKNPEPQDINTVISKLA